jgi:hypothetical protein
MLVAARPGTRRDYFDRKYLSFARYFTKKTIPAITTRSDLAKFAIRKNTF